MVAENAVWSNETTYDGMGVIKELLAFYPDKVDSIAAGLGKCGARFYRP